MKRTSLRRYTPLQRQQLQRRADDHLSRREGVMPRQRGTTLPFRSSKQAALYVERRQLVARLLAERPWCEIRWDHACQGRAVDVDEILGRGVGGDFLDEQNCQTACRHCHDMKQQNPTDAERRGVTVQRRHQGGAA